MTAPKRVAPKTITDAPTPPSTVGTRHESGTSLDVALPTISRFAGRLRLIVPGSQVFNVRPSRSSLRRTSPRSGGWPSMLPAPKNVHTVSSG